MAASSDPKDTPGPLPHFETQSLDEEVIIFMRAHFFTNIWWIFLSVVFVFIPVVLKTVPLAGVPFSFSLSTQTQFLVTLAWYLFVGAFVFQQLLHWLFNIYIVTNKRVVDIDFVNLFYKQISSTTIDNVQDVRHSRGGVAQLIVNYGDVFVQTAGPTEHFEFHAIANPADVQKKIINLLHKPKAGPVGGSK